MVCSLVCLDNTSILHSIGAIFLLISNVFHENTVHLWDMVIFALFDFQVYLLHEDTSYKNSSLL